MCPAGAFPAGTSLAQTAPAGASRHPEGGPAPVPAARRMTSGPGERGQREPER
jgi:hypothetical protein